MRQILSPAVIVIAVLALFVARSKPFSDALKINRESKLLSNARSISVQVYSNGDSDLYSDSSPNALKRREWDILTGLDTTDYDSVLSNESAGMDESDLNDSENSTAKNSGQLQRIRRTLSILPFLPPVPIESPWYLDGSLAGDAGFDPLGLARDAEGLYFFREAEIKHGRIAMLAAIGWPFSELYHYKISSSIGLNDLLAEGGKAPSVLNGGLDNVYTLFALGLFFAVGGVLEFELQRRRKEAPPALQNFMDLWREDDWDAPGNYGFDPLNLRRRLCGDNARRRVVVQTIEIFNGRFAMLATLGFVVQELTTGRPVVSETPQFFDFGILLPSFGF